MKIICLGNYPPRQCGIATFTENLIKSILNAAEIHAIHTEIDIIAMNDFGKSYAYPAIVKNTIRAGEQSNYVQIADFINNSGADIFLLQHEYGIYGGESGVFLLSLLRKIKIPIVSTFHTVLEKPNFHQLEVLRKIAAYSSRVVIMNPLAIKFLTSIYHIRKEKIACIEHGVPDFRTPGNKAVKIPLKWKERKIMLTFGLIGRSKGIETVLRALPLIVKKHPEILYVVLGKTHPHVVQNAGEEYRDSLMSLVQKYKLESNVLFIDEYVSEEELKEYLKRADIYVTPYLNKAQITSGTLSYAVSGGCAVISTPYWHAEQLLADERGILFDFRNYEQLAAIINELLEKLDLLKKFQLNAFHYGKTIAWPIIGKNYLDLFNQVVSQIDTNKSQMRKDIQIVYPVFDISPLKRLTDETGLLQHARTSVPHYKAGYCLDDNSRAIIVCLKAWQKENKEIYLELLDKYLAYMTYMQRKDGSFTNYMTYERTLLDSKSDDAYGRIIWALGYLIRYAPNNSYFHLGMELFENAIPQYGKLNYARGYANCIFGLYHYVLRFPDQEKYLKLLKTLSDKLCEKYSQHKRENWNWFEDGLTYDNGLLPAALYRSYEILGDESYLHIAEESRTFLESKCLREEWLSLIGNRKWLRLDQDYDFFAQQPIDAMAMVILYQCAWEATGNKEFIDKLHLSFDWFFGKNDLDITLFDSESKACNDGIEENNINRNQGAESNIAYLLSYLVAESFFSLSI